MKTIAFILLMMPTLAWPTSARTPETYFSAYYEEVRSAIQEHKENLEQVLQNSKTLKACQLETKNCLLALDEVVRTIVFYYYNSIDLDQIIETSTFSASEKQKLRKLQAELIELTRNPQVQSQAKSCRIRIQESDTDQINIRIFKASLCAYGEPMDFQIIDAQLLTSFLEVAIKDFNQTLQRLDQFRERHQDFVTMSPEVIELLRESYLGKD